MQMKKKNNTGITLIALIITIIVMLILVAVAVNTAVQSGLFGHAKNATESWAKREAEEGNIGNDNFIKDTVNEYTGKIDRSYLKIGDYVDYTPDTAENYMGLGTSENGDENPSGSASNPTDGIPQDTTLKWRIMSINDDGSIDIVSTIPITTSIDFGGALGYNNGVLLLNDLCKTQYSNSTLGANARSINLEDIENKFNSIGIDYRNSYLNSSSNIQYNSSKIYSENYSYAPDIHDYISTSASEKSKNYYSHPTIATFNKKGTLEVQQTYYEFSNISSNNFNNSTFRELIFRY